MRKLRNLLNFVRDLGIVKQTVLPSPESENKVPKKNFSKNYQNNNKTVVRLPQKH
jgi:hypothetical protein